MLAYNADAIRRAPFESGSSCQACGGRERLARVCLQLRQPASPSFDRQAVTLLSGHCACRQWEHLLLSSLLVSKPTWLLHGGAVSGAIAGRESALSEHAYARTRALNLQVGPTALGAFSHYRPACPPSQPCAHTPICVAADPPLMPLQLVTKAPPRPHTPHLLCCGGCPFDVAADRVQQWHVARVCVKPQPDCWWRLTAAATRRCSSAQHGAGALPAKADVMQQSTRQRW